MPTAKGQYPAFTGLGVLTKQGDPKFAKFVHGATADKKGSKVKVLHPDGSTEDFGADGITLHPNTARLDFVSGGDTYRIRDPRDLDGTWASKYKTALPVDAFPAFANQGDRVDPDESLTAYAPDDGAYIVGVTYDNSVGTWLRSGGDWTLMSPDDDTFDDMTALQIDPDAAQEFLDFYDQNYVSVDDAQQYESAESDDPDSDGDSDTNGGDDPDVSSDQ